MQYTLLLDIIAGISLLLWLILYRKQPAFLALLWSSIYTGLLCGLPASGIIDTMIKGMGSTLGFVATVVGLGAMFGAILEHSGGAQAIAAYLLKRFGDSRTPLALSLTGFIVAIPVFFDVAFIILIPVVYALQRRTGKSLLLYAIPLLAGLATTHTFIPPTPGPIAVADILKADLGWVIAIGFLVALPTTLISGWWFGQRIGTSIHVEVPAHVAADVQTDEVQFPPVGIILLAIGLPILLIVLATASKSGIIPVGNEEALAILQLIGHPFVALLLANALVWYALGIRRGVARADLQKITNQSLAPAGSIILLTGAGGVFKQVLIDTGAGKMLAEVLTGAGLPIILFGFLTAALVRVAQGSATVSMITAAGLVAPLLETGTFTLGQGQLACLVVAIASGASVLSHVNDSGFWLVKQYLGLDEKQTFRSWTVMITLLGLTGFLVAWGVYGVL